jgi:hypothetical protein
LHKKCHGPGIRGLLAELECRRISKARKEAIGRREACLAELWQLESIGRLASEVSKQAMHCTYLLAGYHRTSCHHWNRKESLMDIPTLASLTEKEPATQVEEKALQEQVAQPEPPPKQRSSTSFWPESIEETIKLVMSGRQDLLEHLRSQLAEVPDLWRQVGDLTRSAIQGWAKKISQGNIAFEESIVLASIEERKNLLGQASTIMERSIVEKRFHRAKMCARTCARSLSYGAAIINLLWLSRFQSPDTGAWPSLSGNFLVQGRVQLMEARGKLDFRNAQLR